MTVTDTSRSEAHAAPQDGYTAALARYVSEFQYERLPEAVRASARDTTLDTLGAMLAAASPRYEAGGILGRVLGEQGGAAQATVIGRGERTSVIQSALLNGTLAYYCDIETLHSGAIMHGAAVVLPAALAVAESRGLGGADLLAALVLGIDVACRVSYAIGPNALYARGFHPTSVAGAFGAAAAAGWLLRLDPHRQEQAFGLTANQASGLLAWASDHTEMSRPLNSGIAARDGVTAALLAEAGFGGPLRVLDPDEKYNIFRAWSERPEPDALLADQYARYCLTEASFKRYACCGFLHPALDAVGLLVDEDGVDPDAVRAIRLRFAPSGRAMIDHNPLRSHRAQYILPVGLFRRRVLIDDILTDRGADDPRIARLGEHVSLVPDDALEPLYPERYASIVELDLADGRCVSRRVDWPRGHPQNPFTPAELTAKFLGLAGEVAGPESARAVVGLMDELDQLPTLAPLIEHLRGSPPPRTGGG